MPNPEQIIGNATVYFLFFISEVSHDVFSFAIQPYRKKFEIATDEIGTPIKQDTKKGMLREVSGSFFVLSESPYWNF